MKSARPKRWSAIAATIPAHEFIIATESGMLHRLRREMPDKVFHATLRARRARIVARIPAEEHVLELHHARIGKEQRRIVSRHE